MINMENDKEREEFIKKMQKRFSEGITEDITEDDDFLEKLDILENPEAENNTAASATADENKEAAIIENMLAGDAEESSIYTAEKETAEEASTGESEKKEAETEEIDPSLSESVIVLVSEDKMSADIMVNPRADGSIPSVRHLLSLLEVYDVREGIDMELLKKIAEGNELGKRVEIAKGKEAKDGADGRFEFLVDPNPKREPTILPDGSVDYKDVELFVSVRENDELIRYIPHTMGIGGYDITGRFLPAKNGKKLPPLKCTGVNVSEDGCIYTAAYAGRIEANSDGINVYNQYVLSEDLTPKIGNIKFSGDVVISGDVLAGMKIEALGSVTVSGHVGAAEIYAGREVLLREGMQGQGVGKIVAAGKVSGRFFESSSIYTLDNFEANYILNCVVESKGNVIIAGKMGSIIGGDVYALKGVEVASIGNDVEIPTVVRVGINQDRKEKYNRIIKKLSELQQELVTYVEGKKKIEDENGEVKEEYKDVYTRLINLIKSKTKEINITLKRKQEIVAEIAETKNAKVVVKKNLYPNVKIFVDMLPVLVRCQVKDVTVKRKGGHAGVFENH